MLTDLDEVVCSLTPPAIYEEDEDTDEDEATEPEVIGEESEEE